MEESHNAALRDANVALSGRRRREASRFASIELRVTDQRHDRWEVAAIASLAFAAVLVVLGLWFL